MRALSPCRRPVLPRARQHTASAATPGHTCACTRSGSGCQLRPSAAQTATLYLGAEKAKLQLACFCMHPFTTVPFFPLHHLSFFFLPHPFSWFKCCTLSAEVQKRARVTTSILANRAHKHPHSCFGPNSLNLGQR